MQQLVRSSPESGDGIAHCSNCVYGRLHWRRITYTVWRRMTEVFWTIISVTFLVMLSLSVEKVVSTYD